MKLSEQIQFILNEEGKRSFAILPFNVFEEVFEDYLDSKIIEERKDEPSISLEQLEEELKTDGKL